MVYDGALAARVREILLRFQPVEERRMFGGLCFMYKQRMCCGVMHDDLIARLAPEDATAALEEPYVRPFDFTGRPMAGTVYVGATGLDDWASLVRWVLLSVAFVDSLPPKPAKTVKRPKTRPR